MWLSWTILIIINMASQGLIWCGFRVILYDRACCNDCTCSPNKIFKYSNIFVRNLRIFEYIRNLTFWCFEYSNIFVSQFFYIRIRILNIRPKIFEYSNIFEYSLRSELYIFFLYIDRAIGQILARIDGTTVQDPLYLGTKLAHRLG